MSFFTPIGPLLKGWVISFLCWGFVALVVGVQFISRTSLPWTEAIYPVLRDWLPWAILTPLLFRFASRVPLDRPTLRVALPMHIACCIVIVAFCHWWRHHLFDFPRFPMLRGGEHVLPDRNGASLEVPGALVRVPPAKHFDLVNIASFQLPVYLMIMGGAHAVFFYRRAQERASSLARARLESLRMQLQPHFLFNTLNTIAGLVYEAPQKADAMLVALSDLLRLSLETSSELELPLRREVELVKRYLELLHARFEQRLRFQIDIESEANPALVPGFILQPLVENAVRHGLLPRAGGGLVSIRAWREGSDLRISVADDGVGLMNPEAMREGIGLGNTKARLQEMYGARGRIELREEHGTICDISLPYHTTV